MHSKLQMVAALTVSCALLAGCAQLPGNPANMAADACSRSDVQDVVGKEARSLMLKGNRDNILMAGMMGLDLDAIFKAWEAARVTFSNVGAFQSNGPPFQRIACGGAVQFDLSDATAGQQIVNLPRLQWTINFPQPTNDPSTGAFTIEIDPASLVDGRTLNGKSLIVDHAPDDAGQVDQGPPPEPPSTSDATMDDAAAAAKAAADDFNEADAPDDRGGKVERQSSKRGGLPSDDDLYAPH